MTVSLYRSTARGTHRYPVGKCNADSFAVPIPRSYLELGQACVRMDYLLEQKIFVTQAACEHRESTQALPLLSLSLACILCRISSNVCMGSLFIITLYLWKIFIGFSLIDYYFINLNNIYFRLFMKNMAWYFFISFQYNIANVESSKKCQLYFLMSYGARLVKKSNPCANEDIGYISVRRNMIVPLKWNVWPAH